jgi:hypothetical protein
VSAGPFEVDHVFVAVSRGAPEMDGLLGHGFREGSPNAHPGQGTACRRVFFENAYLELIWLEDAAEASAPAIARTRLAFRAGRQKCASWLGVALRPRQPGEVVLPVPTWSYQPPYLPEGAAIPVAESSRTVAEPLIFFMPRRKGWRPPPLPHPNGARRVTDVVLTFPPDPEPSRTLHWLARSDCVRVEPGPAEKLVVSLDHGASGRSLDLSPETPLRLTW